MKSTLLAKALASLGAGFLFLALVLSADVAHACWLAGGTCAGITDPEGGVVCGPGTCTGISSGGCTCNPYQNMTGCKCS